MLQQQYSINQLQLFYEKTAERHGHLCPRQVLGVRMGFLAAQLLELELPQKNKRLLTIVETDGCFVSGVEVSTGCAMSRRTLRMIDYGKVAATFIDTETENAVRIVPHPESRENAQKYAPDERSRWHSYLEAYQHMPPELLFVYEYVQLTRSLSRLISHSKYRVKCELCGEEILNQREFVSEGHTFCKACVVDTYYKTI